MLRPIDQNVYAAQTHMMFIKDGQKYKVAIDKSRTTVFNGLPWSPIGHISYISVNGGALVLLVENHHKNQSTLFMESMNKTLALFAASCMVNRIKAEKTKETVSFNPNNWGAPCKVWSKGSETKYRGCFISLNFPDSPALESELGKFSLLLKEAKAFTAEEYEIFNNDVRPNPLNGISKKEMYKDDPKGPPSFKIREDFNFGTPSHS